MTCIRFLISCLPFIAVLPLNGCVNFQANSVKANAGFLSPQNDVKHDQVEAEVEFDRETGVCVSSKVQVTPAQQIVDTARQWRNKGNYEERGEYLPPAVVYQNTSVEYPKSLWQDRVYGTVVMLILIKEDGSVASAKAVCATRPEFVPYARKTVMPNRYRSGTINGKAIQDAAFQKVSFIPRPYQ